LTTGTLTPKDVMDALGDSLISASGDPATFTSPCIDSREAVRGSLFFATRGGHQDGHDFIDDALARGAAGAVVERPFPAPKGCAAFHTSNSLTALQRIAAARRHHHSADVIAVTGSVGKTTCKEVIAAVLARRFNILKSEANLNTEIGIPLTLLSLKPEHDRAVLEFGMYQPGDIALLADIALPRIGVITMVNPVHLERAGSIGRIAAAKAELVEALPRDGLAVLNGDDARVAAMRQRTSAKAVLYGVSEQCDFRASDVQSRGLAGFSFTLSYAKESVRVDCGLPGRHHVYPALAAAAVASSEGMSLGEIADALSDVPGAARMTMGPGPNGATLIDDSYNASPASMCAALDLLAECEGRRVAVLGHMRELGRAEDEGHLQVGHHAAGRCDVLIVAGEDAALIAEAARNAGHRDVRMAVGAEQARELLLAELRPGDHVLIKASRAVGLESVVHDLVAR
jgi:UDP-N-acetylmuramoyl-tripeptide--D-alanyl-D-alanine ligase